MEQTGQFINGMPGQDVDEASLRDALHNVLKQATRNGTPALATLSQLQNRRAEKLNVAAKALSKELGKDHPDVIAMQASAATVTQLNTQVATQADRLKTWPKIRPNEWAVFGTVLDAKNQPVSGATVRVFDRDRKYDDLLGETETDAQGDFSIVYHERDFKETNENLPELYVMVTDAKGNQVYSSRDSVRFKSGQLEYFAIRLGQQVGRTTTKAAKTTKTTKPAATRVSRKKSG